MGIRYAVGDVIQPNCTTRCICQGGFFACELQKCVVDGATCVAWGDPHYESFDHDEYDFQGDCEYVLSQPCNDSREFIITGSNTLIENKLVSYTSEVRIILQKIGLEIILGIGYIKINGKNHLTGSEHKVIRRSSGVEITSLLEGAYVLLTISHPISITWKYRGGLGDVRITVSSKWQGMLCGLCGNYNNDSHDDYKLPNGTITNSIDEFGSSWLHSRTSPSCGIPRPPEPCDMIAAESRCNELRMGVFSVCNSEVNPSETIAGCILDYCSCSEEEREDCYCNSLSKYAEACASVGLMIPNWRTFFCRK